MVILNILVEGQTEAKFVKEVLKPHLNPQGIYPKPYLVTTDRSQNICGGSANYAKIKNEINRLWREKNSQPVMLTTMFDLYGLPTGFPNFDQANKLSDPYLKVKYLEDSFAGDIDDHRFIPYIQLHEFEALIFTDLRETYIYFPQNDQYKKDIDRLFVECNRKYPSPELINENIATAPSKRLEKVIPNYKKLKTSLATQVIAKIGLVKIREKCPHFDRWVTQLEGLT